MALAVPPTRVHRGRHEAKAPRKRVYEGGRRKSERKVANTARLVSRIYKCQNIRGGTALHPLTAHRIPLCPSALPLRSPSSISKMSYFNNNNLSGMTYGGYPFAGDNNFNGYSFGHDQYPDFTTQSGLFNSDAAAIAGPSGSYDWYLDPSSDGYQGWTLLDVSGHQLVDPYTLHTGTYNDLETGESRCCRS